MSIIVTILGSTRFRVEIKTFAWSLTKQNILVLFAPFAKEEILELEEYRDILEKQHFQKIDLSSTVIVYNPDGIGEHTYHEILYSREHGKLVRFVICPFYETRNEEVLDFNKDFHWCQYCGMPIDEYISDDLISTLST